MTKVLRYGMVGGGPDAFIGALKVRIHGSRGTIQWFQENPDQIRVITADGTINEIHRGYDAITGNAARYKRLPSGHPEGCLRQWVICTAALRNAFMQKWQVHLQKR